jgi:hypothetical protein
LGHAERINKNLHQPHLVRCLCHLLCFLNFIALAHQRLLVLKLSKLWFEGHIFVIYEGKMSQDKKVVVETKLSEEEKLFEEKKVANPYIAGFIESMAKSNIEKTTKEILEGLSEDTGDSDDYDAESGGEDSEDRPWRPSHTIFGKSTIK